MKCKLTFLIILLVTAFAVTPSCASNIVVTLDHETNYQTSHASSDSFGVKGESITPKHQGNPARPDNEDGPQLRQTPDATVNASIIPASASILALIAILHLMVKGTIPLSQDPTRQTLLQKILFRVIISPNAP